MKVLKFICTGMMLFLAISLHAQVSVNVNIGVPPPWGPVGFTSVRYYYLPDVEAYYDVQSSMFIYYGGGVWVHRAYLPARYKNYDLYGGYKVVMKDYHGNAPYAHFKEHKVKYAKGYHGGPQRTIGKKPGKGHSDSKSSYENNHGNKDGGGGKGKGHGGDNGKKK